jgi:serine/threonine protein kinase
MPLSTCLDVRRPPPLRLEFLSDDVRLDGAANDENSRQAQTENPLENDLPSSSLKSIGEPEASDTCQQLPLETKHVQSCNVDLGARRPKRNLMIEIQAASPPPPSGQSPYRDTNCSPLRHEGVTIGADYMRCLGKTLIRGSLSSKTLVILDDSTDDQDFCGNNDNEGDVFSTASYSSSEKATQATKRSNILGRGAFSTVHRGYWYHATDSHPNDGRGESRDMTVVAVKRLAVYTAPNQPESQRLNMLLREIKTLASLQHDGLLRLYGAYLDHGDDASSFGSTTTLVTVLEYMDFGSLHDLFLEQHRRCGEQEDAASESGRSDTLARQFEGGKTVLSGTASFSPFLSYSTIAAISYQILGGLSYLHANYVIHRDLKPSNVVLNTSGCVKLCDFGMVSINNDSSHASNFRRSDSCEDDGGSSGDEADENNDIHDIQPPVTVMNTTVLGTKKYMAPERLRNRVYGRSSDLWSLGLILHQCVTGLLVPFPHIHSAIDLIITIEEDDIVGTMATIPPDGSESSVSGGQSSSSLAAPVRIGLQQILRSCLNLEPGKDCYPDSRTWQTL